MELLLSVMQIHRSTTRQSCFQGIGSDEFFMALSLVDPSHPNPVMLHDSTLLFHSVLNVQFHKSLSELMDCVFDEL